MLRAIAPLSLAALSFAAPTAAQAPVREAPATVPTGCANGLWEHPFNHDTTGFTQQPFANRFNAVHLNLIPVGHHRGELMVWDFEDQHDPSATGDPGTWLQRWALVKVPPPGGRKAGFWNFELELPFCRGDLFCSGHVWDTEGRLFIAGGTTGYGSYGPNYQPPPAPGLGNEVQPQPCHPKYPESIGGRLAYYWDPRVPHGQDWIRLPDLEAERYYPSANLLPDGRLLVSGGGPSTSLETYDNSYEVFDPRTMQWEDNGGTQVFPGPQYPDGRDPAMLYPRLHPLTTGELFLSSMTGWTARLNHAVAPGVWQITGRTMWDYRIYGNAVLLPDEYDGPNQVLVVGGNTIIGFPPNPYTVFGATATVEQCDAAGATPADWAFRQVAPTNVPRQYSTLVTLPDATILVSAGRSTGPNWTAGQYVSSLELYTPATRTWREIETAHHSRSGPTKHGNGYFTGYHQTAVLLPDARVLIAGGNVRSSDYNIYVPPYLTCGEERPVITDAPQTIRYGQAFAVRHAEMLRGRTVERAVLMAPGATTHHFDFSARHVSLEKVAVAPGGGMLLNAPPNAFHANPGYYMLFLLSDRGVPSVASWVELR